MNPSSGLGQPGPGQPEFDGPVTDGSWSGSVPPAQFGSPSHSPAAYPPPASPQPAGYPPPATAPQPVPQQSVPQQPVPPGPWGPPSLTPSGPPPGGPPRRAGARALLVGGTILVVVVVLGLLAWQLLPATPAATPTPSAIPPATPAPPAPPPASMEPTVVRTPETPAPTVSAQVTGGSIGQQIRFRTSGGEAQVTVARATWADNGVLPPGEGMSYLVVDVRFEGVSGSVTTGPFFTAVREPGGDRQLMTIGAQLDNQLAMRTIRAGQDNTGQVAFEIARGPVTFEVLSELLEPLATVEIPG